MSQQITVKDLEQFETQWEVFSDILMKNFGDIFANKITIKNKDNNSDEFDGLDKNEMVKNMADIIYDPERCREIGEFNYNLGKKYFSFDVLEEKLSGLFNF